MEHHKQLCKNKDIDIKSLDNDLGAHSENYSQLELSFNETKGKFNISEKSLKEYKFKNENLEFNLIELSEESKNLSDRLKHEENKSFNLDKALVEYQAKLNTSNNKIQRMDIDLATLKANNASINELKDKFSTKMDRVASDLSTQESLNEDLSHEVRKA